METMCAEKQCSNIFKVLNEKKPDNLEFHILGKYLLKTKVN